MTTRDELAARQQALVRALLTGAPVPTGFDAHSVLVEPGWHRGTCQQGADQCLLPRGEFVPGGHRAWSTTVRIVASSAARSASAG